MVLDAALPLVTRKPDKRTETEELRMEVRAAGLEMRDIGRRIFDALTSGHTAVAMHEAGRLVTLGEGYAHS